MRATLLALLLLAAAACTRPPPAQVACTLTIFNDGFHSGLIWPAAELPIELSSRSGSASGSHVELGFSEWKWVTWEDRSCPHACGLLFVPGDGAMIVRFLGGERRDERSLTPRTAWRLPLAAEARDAVAGELAAWIDAEKGAVRNRADPTLYYVHSTRRYSLLANCHDWTAHMLRTAGLPMPRRGVRTPEKFDTDLRTCMTRLKSAGWPVAEVGADDPLFNPSPQAPATP